MLARYNSSDGAGREPQASIASSNLLTARLATFTEIRIFHFDGCLQM
jgi:hypothetical protein